MFFQRNIQQKLEKALARSPIVLLTGPRQSGKTMLMQHIAKEKNYSYITFDDIQMLALAKNNPIGFINDLKKPVILDEVQRVPELFLTIKKDVDQNRQPGRYALTGSANPLLLPALGDSLAGRMEVFYLYSLSQGELSGRKELFVDHVFSHHVRDLNHEKMTKNDVYKKMIVGGFPPILSLDDEGRQAWFAGYVTSLIERDVKDLSKITDLVDFPKLLNILATRVSGLVNFSDLSRESALVTTTLRRYLALLQALYLIQFSMPWSTNIGLRFVKAPKLYFADTGLLSYMLNLNYDKIQLEPNMSGKIFENFIVSELRKQMTWSNERVNMYHFRDHAGSEVDIVLEHHDGRIVAVEAKNTETVLPHDFKALRLLQEKMKDRFVTGLILYQGSAIIPAGDNLFAVPVSVLWT